MPKFVHVDIAADDPPRAAAFYSEVFSWKTNKLEGPTPYWLLSTSDDETAVGAGIGQRDAPWQSVAPTIEVPSADAFTRKIEAAGGEIVVPKVHMPGVGYLVTFKDTEGNVMAILEPAQAPG